MLLKFFKYDKVAWFVRFSDQWQQLVLNHLLTGKSEMTIEGKGVAYVYKIKSANFYLLKL